MNTRKKGAPRRVRNDVGQSGFRNTCTPSGCFMGYTFRDTGLAESLANDTCQTHQAGAEQRQSAWFRHRTDEFLGFVGV